MVLQLSSQASHGFRNASSYDTHRPSYPLEVVDDMLAHLQVKDVPNARIVDLGAGTGKFTELLAARGEKYHVVAVEPHEEMRKALSAKGLSTVDVLDGYANNNAPESWEPTTKWEATMKEIMWSYHDQRPRFRHDLWRNVFDKQVSSTPFTIQAADPLFSLPLGEDSTKFIDWLHPDAIWGRFRSLSQISILEGDELAVGLGLDSAEQFID
ncbi:MAG: hypothetical protein Q9205_000079 [Flavoplaca limonia]